MNILKNEVNSLFIDLSLITENSKKKRKFSIHLHENIHLTFIIMIQLLIKKKQTKLLFKLSIFVC